jgi:melanoma-associated antigen p97
MQKIRVGDADLITLDAADVYVAGMSYHMVPIAAEDYSGADQIDGGYDQYLSVAAVRRADSFLTLFNMKQRRSHAAVMSAAGWVIPVDMLIKTGQINIIGCDAYLAVGQYFSKSCVPGVLHDYYNSHSTNPVSLCEACGLADPTGASATTRNSTTAAAAPSAASPNTEET